MREDKVKKVGFFTSRQPVPTFYNYQNIFYTAEDHLQMNLPFCKNLPAKTLCMKLGALPTLAERNQSFREDN